MSQKAVEVAIGRLVTDEALRERWSRDRAAVLKSLADEGIQLSALEAMALGALEPHALDQFARAVDDRLQRAALFPEGPHPRRKRSER